MDELLLPALLTAGAIMLLYERTDEAVVTEGSRSGVMGALHKQIDEVLAQLTDAYYQEYIYPHTYPVYQLHLPANKSETRNKRDIYLLVTDPRTGVMFDRDTLLIVATHELAHVLCQAPENDPHGLLFQGVQDRLIQIASRKRLFNTTRSVPSNYMQCL